MHPLLGLFQSGLLRLLRRLGLTNDVRTMQQNGAQHNSRNEALLPPILIGATAPPCSGRERSGRPGKEPPSGLQSDNLLVLGSGSTMTVPRRILNAPLTVAVLPPVGLYFSMSGVSVQAHKTSHLNCQI